MWWYWWWLHLLLILRLWHWLLILSRLYLFLILRYGCITTLYMNGSNFVLVYVVIIVVVTFTIFSYFYRLADSLFFFSFLLPSSFLSPPTPLFVYASCTSIYPLSSIVFTPFPLISYSPTSSPIVSRFLISYWGRDPPVLASLKYSWSCFLSSVLLFSSSLYLSLILMSILELKKLL